MKTQSLITSALTFIFLLGGAVKVYAEKMSLEAQDLVVQKMERVLEMMDKNDSSRWASEQRLADLLAERARMRFMLEVEAECTGCKGSQDDRKRATQLYEALLNNINLKGDGRILFQLAHLYQMGGQINKAQSLFEQVIKVAKKKPVAKTILTRSHVGLADLLFQKGQPQKAHPHYIVALKDQELENRAFIIYNKAWCEFNMGRLNTAINSLRGLLLKPDSITRTTEAGVIQDQAFRLDMLRDLATFYARKPVTNQHIQQYIALIPESNRKELILHFAEEVNRIGQKKAALTLLDRYLQEPKLTVEEKLNAYVMKAQAGYDSGLTQQSAQDFAKAAATLRDYNCRRTEDCVKLQKTMKHYVTELHRSKKLKPDLSLINTYGIYSSTFPDDKDMHTRGAAVATEIGQYAVAIDFYRRISTNSTFSDKDRNQALVDEVATAEKSNKPKLKIDSYHYFLKNSQDENKKFEVRYQLAYLSYQAKQYREAAEAFHKLVVDKKGNATLRKKSADLALDSLAHLKDDRQIEQYAWSYAEILPQAKSEFEGLARKALMNQVPRATNAKNPDTSEMKNLLKKTMAVNLTKASESEKILFYSNASVLAYKLDDRDQYIKAQMLLLQQRGLPESKRQEVYANMATYHEKHLNFKDAYAWAKKIKNPKVSKVEVEFRLGTLADLAQINSSRHYQNSLKAGLRGPREIVVRTRLVALSQNPVRELKRQAKFLKKSPQALNDLVLFVYARTQDKKSLIPLLKTPELRNRSAARFILSQDLYGRLGNIQSKIARAGLRTHPAKSLERDTTRRIKLLSELDQLLNESLKSKDITAQMIALDTISAENKRFADDLKSLPEPKGLNPHQQKQYTKILESRLTPYYKTAQAAQQKRDELWEKSKAIKGLITDYEMARPEIQTLMRPRLKLLSEVSGSGRLRSDLYSSLSRSQVTVKELQSARKLVSSNPDNRREIENLKILETKLGHPLMPSYLEARLNLLEKEKKL